MVRFTGKSFRLGEKIRHAGPQRSARGATGFLAKKTPHVRKTYGVSYLAAKKPLSRSLLAEVTQREPS